MARKDCRGNRKILRAKARAGHYFWLPCPICGEDFAGFEWTGNVLVGAGRSHGTCPNCPGQWLRRGDHYVEVRVDLDYSGKPCVQIITSSSDWYNPRPVVLGESGD